VLENLGVTPPTWESGRITPPNTGLDAANEDKEGVLYIFVSFEGAPKSDIAPLAKIQAAALGIRCVFTKNTLTILSTNS